MAAAKLGGEDYLPTIGRELRPAIDVFWTGPEIISREITLAHVQELHAVLRRPPLIWDNLHANDYDGHRFYCGPYAGRPVYLREVAEIIDGAAEPVLAAEFAAITDGKIEPFTAPFGHDASRGRNLYFPFPFA